MCGIAGFTGAPDPPRLTRMLGLIAHRGPDGEGRYEPPGVTLGMRRLAVIDLPGGGQPKADESGTVQVVFNGEIYNHRELQKELEAKGHRFASRSDTEVLPHLYEEYGEEFPSRLRGMFAIALWDGRRRRLLLVRDRVGKKPLFYAVHDGRLWFGSELKCLLGAGLPREADPEALRAYLSFLYVPAPRTIFRGIAALRPGHVLTVSVGADLQVGPCEIRSYWRLDVPREKPKRTAAQAAEEALARLDEAVRIRLESDVPLGVFLSAGLDSSLILALAARHTAGSVKTFTVGFGAEAAGYDETEFAARLAREFGADHHPYRAECRVADLLPQVLWGFDQPFGNSTAILSSELARLTRQSVTVALSGTGGDEAFLGYPRYLGVAYRSAYRKLPAGLRRGVLGPLTRSLPEFPGSNFPAARFTKRLRRFVSGAEGDPDASYLRWVTYFDAAEQEDLLAPGWGGAADPGAAVREALSASGAADPLDRAYVADVATFLPYNQLEYVDRTSMSHSLEVRAPFCDHELLEFAAGLPPGLKVRGGRGKWVLRRAASRVLPRWVLDRGKVGFDAPVGVWFRGELKPICDRFFSPEALRETGLLNPEAVARLRADHDAGRRDLSVHLWMLLVLEVWYRLYILGGITDRPTVSLEDLVPVGAAS